MKRTIASVSTLFLCLWIARCSVPVDADRAIATTVLHGAETADGRSATWTLVDRTIDFALCSEGGDCYSADPSVDDLDSDAIAGELLAVAERIVEADLADHENSDARSDAACVKRGLAAAAALAVASAVAYKVARRRAIRRETDLSNWVGDEGSLRLLAERTRTALRVSTYSGIGKANPTRGPIDINAAIEALVAVSRQTRNEHAFERAVQLHGWRQSEMLQIPIDGRAMMIPEVYAKITLQMTRLELGIDEIVEGVRRGRVTDTFGSAHVVWTSALVLGATMVHCPGAFRPN